MAPLAGRSAPPARSESRLGRPRRAMRVALGSALLLSLLLLHGAAAPAWRQWPGASYPSSTPALAPVFIQVPFPLRQPRGVHSCIAGLAGFAVALGIVGPAIPFGPTLTLPIGLMALLGLVAHMHAALPAVAALGVAVAGLPLAHLYMLMPCGILQYTTPGIVGPMAGLCTAFLLGGERGVEVCIPMVGLLAFAHLVFLLRILKMGGWN
mmetsp:Transcript_95133/g.308044  ORF Transcript_95133/g.308044 Transcript_95133/m.308044 type:complete len:209 (+) Transcript_95133:73-699(+)